MKKSLLVTAIALAISSTTALADGRGDVYPEQDKGTAIGALFGVIAGGPPGLIIGAVAGSLVGHNAGLENDLKATEQQLAAAEQQETHTEQAAFEPQPSLLTDAIGDGFAVSVLFRTDSAQLEAPYQQQLADLSSLLANIDALQVEIIASTDERGTEQYNRQLAQYRADSIQRLLLTHGFSRQQLSQTVNGEQFARQQDQDPAGLMFDRRAEIHFKLKP